MVATVMIELVTHPSPGSREVILSESMLPGSCRTAYLWNESL